jgi:hypothetical protein
MPRVGFEHTIRVFEQAKTVRTLDHAATVVGNNKIYCSYNDVKTRCIKMFRKVKMITEYHFVSMNGPLSQTVRESLALYLYLADFNDG